MKSARVVTLARRSMFARKRLLAQQLPASLQARCERLLPRRQVLDDHGLIAGLRQYVAKNSRIPDFKRDIEVNYARHETLLTALQLAIDEGNFSAEVLQHKDCLRHLLYLIERGDIAYWQGMTVYSHVIAKAQFAHYQLLKTSDQNFKSNSELSVFSLVENGRMTARGDEYLIYVTEKLRGLQIEIDTDELADYILRLPFSEQKVLKISYDRNAREGENDEAVDRTIAILVSNIPYLQDYVQNYCNLPSMSVINFIHEKMSSLPLQMKPVFGAISSKELQHLHSMDQHPVALYHPDVKSNVMEVHSRPCGPFPVMLHDIAHAFLANMLSENERSILYQVLIPMIEKVIEECASDILIRKLKEIHYRLNDYNLTHVYFYQNKHRRFAAHVERIFNDELLGTYDRFRFCLSREYEDVVMKMKTFIDIEASKDNADKFWVSFKNSFDSMVDKFPLNQSMSEKVTRRFT